MTINKLGISGDHVYQESGAIVDISGQPVTISGDWIEAHILSGEISIKSGAYVIADISGQIVTMSGDHFYQESGAYVQIQPGIQISGAVIVSGNLSADVSGNWVEAHILSGEVSIQSGAYVIIQPGIQVSGTVAVSGTLSADVSGQWVESHILSGEVSIQSGAQVITQSGIEIIWRGIQVSGTVEISGDLSANISGQWVESHILSGEVSIETPSTIKIAAPTNPKQIHSLSGGTPLQSGTSISVIIKSLSGNSDMYVGGFTTGHRPYSGCGLLLAGGEAINIDVDEMGKINLFAANSGNMVSYLGVI